MRKLVLTVLCTLAIAVASGGVAGIESERTKVAYDVPPGPWYASTTQQA